MTRAEYMDVLLKLADDGRPAPLKLLIAARVRGQVEPVDVEFGDVTVGVASPPLERDEPDHNAILYTAFSILRKEPDARGLENLRRAVKELFLAALEEEEDLAAVRMLARLVGHLRLVDSEELRPQLLNQLYAYLDMGLGLDRPFEEVLRLEGEPLDRAIVAFDVWLSVLPILPDLSQHLAAKIKAILTKSCGIVDAPQFALERQFSFLFLAFRAFTKLKPADVASEWVGEVCRLVAKHSVSRPNLKGRWLAACQHQDVVFDANPKWRDAFVRGLGSNKNRQRLQGVNGAEFFRESLKLLGVWEEAEAKLMPRPASPERVPLAA